LLLEIYKLNIHKYEKHEIYKNKENFFTKDYIDHLTNGGVPYSDTFLLGKSDELPKF
jgi:hypothetical protein